MFGGGSTHEGPGEARQIADGLHTERADAEGLRGSFTQNGTTIYFEAIRGEDNPAEVTADPSAPAYAVDARFFDEDGTSFLVSTGGHELKEAAWHQESSAFNPEQRIAALTVVSPLVAALQNAEMPFNLALERERLVDLGKSIGDVEFVQEPESETPYACTDAFVHQMYVREKAAFDLPIGNHTAVYVDSWFLDTSCTWLYVGRQESCNHGTCATHASMSHHCSWESGYRSYSFPAFQVYSAYGNGACSTFYNPLSNLGGHNCNDDTYFQIHNIKNDTYYPAATGPSNICTDSIGHSYAPSCSGARGAP